MIHAQDHGLHCLSSLLRRRQLEDRWNERAEQHRTETEAVHRQLQEAEGLLEQLREGLASAQEVARRDLRRLGSDREPIVRELRRLQDEVDVLTGKHSAKAAEMQNEAINLPEDREEMQLLLLRLREDLIAAKVSAERADEKMMTEVRAYFSLLQVEIVQVGNAAHLE